MRRLLVPLLFGLTVVRPALADGPPPEAAGNATDIGYRYAVDVPITVGAIGFWVLTEANKEDLAPDACRLCLPAALDGRVRDAVVWSDPDPARTTSDVLLFGAAPVTAVTSAWLIARADGETDQVLEDVLMIAEAAAIAAALNQSTKLLVGRRRPFVHALPPAERSRTDDPADNNLSFYSGHTSMAFALTAATASVAHLRGYEHASWAWYVGLPVSFATGYLRMAGDKHYLTDVLTSAVVGTAVGWAVPTLHAYLADGSAPTIAFRSTEGGGALSLTWAF